MQITKRMKLHTLITRELQEYRNSVIFTPVIIGGGLLVLMLLGVLFVGRITMLGDGVMHLISEDGGAPGVSVGITIDSGGETSVIREDIVREEEQAAEQGLELQQLVIEPVPTELPEDAWNFSQEWSFSAPRKEKSVDEHEHEFETLNPVLNGLNGLFIFVLFIVSANYLLGSLYQDRKDRSILFWRSMPVSETEEVLCKLAVASVVAPVVYLAVSVVTQLLWLGTAMLFVWRMDGTPVETVLGNVQFVPLLLNQVGAVLVWSAWTLPVYAWLLLASAAARRSPFMLAISIPLGLVFVERILLGSNHVLLSLGHHLPHLADGDDANSLGLYRYGPVWSSLDYVGMMMGVGLAAVFLAGAIWLRRHRFEV